MKKLLILNWKMNPVTLHEASVLAQASDHENVIVAPSFPFLEEVGKVLKKAELGAQDVFYESKGAFTGEVSAKELKSVGVQYVIVGHSERRHKLGETDEIIAKKMKATVSAGLIPILCVGETKEEKAAGQREAVIERQLKSALSNFRLSTFDFRLLVAYEPVWAIGTGDPETPESALVAIKFIKNNLRPTPYALRTKVLYGGSVTSKNLGDYLKYKEVDGALVGGASLKPEEIEKMIKLL